MTFNPPTTISMNEFRMIRNLYNLTGSEHKTQKEIKAAVDYERVLKGTYTGQGISTNTISRLSPRSKHRQKYETHIIATQGEWIVSHNIAKCRHCSLSDAREIYWKYVVPISPYNFYDPNQRNQVAVRVAVGNCYAPLYFHISTIGYEETMFGDDPDHYVDDPTKLDIWTIKSRYIYSDLLNGHLPMGVIMDYLTERVGGAYEFEYVNTTITDITV